jgi:predicted flap endonuclease-1-like 5' DNA nuclease
MRRTPDDTHPNADSFPSGLSGPALRALAHAGIRTMAQLAQHTESEVASLHGMGPKGVRLLRDALHTERRHFREE